ncbi:MAG: hypothetical protein PVF74_03110, partial [Anaerolineales bacterium]
VLQFDDTKNIYNHPAAMEVGRLFGDPPMMFFEGVINEQNQFAAQDGSFSLATEGTVSHLHPAQQVILGLRPVDVKLASPEESDITGEVYSVQNQFDRQLVTLVSNGNLIDVIAPVNLSISEGNKAGVRVAPEICYYFDQDTHKAL